MKKEENKNYTYLLLCTLVCLLPLSLQAQAVKEYKDSLVISTNTLRITANKATGKVNYHFNNGVILDNTVAAIKDEHAGDLASSDFDKHNTTTAPLKNGILLTITHMDNKHPLRLLQHIHIYKNNVLLIDVEAVGDQVLESRHITPLAVFPGQQGKMIIPGAEPRILDFPFDNDNWVSSISRSWLSTTIAGTSYELAALYNKTNFSGFVTGSVEHDTWKTGIVYKTNPAKGSLDSFYIYGGAATADNNALPPLFGGQDGTHDHAPHGLLKGKSIISPLIYLAGVPDIREGLKGYGMANATQAGALHWKGYAPFYWNSYGVEGVLGYENIMMPPGVEQVSDSLHTLKNFHKYASPVLSIDSYDQRIYSTEVLNGLGRYAKARGQQIGFYFIPFALWTWNNMIDREVLGNTGARLKDIVLRDSSMNPIAYKNGEWGAFAIDPTHPAVRQYIIAQLQKAKAINATFLKIDFLTAGSLESLTRYDKNVHTGMQAYNGGMKMLKHLSDSILGPDIFITMAISPMFPHQYAHTRFVSTDVYSHLRDDQPGFPHYGSTEASLAAGSHMWWMQGTLWPYTNLDIAIMKKFQKNPMITEQEIKVRIYAMMTMGSIFGDGSDLRDSLAMARARKYLDHPEVCAFFSHPEAFTPLNMADGESKDQQLAFYLGGNRRMLALFNFDTQRTFNATLNTKELGLKSQAYIITDLLTGQQIGKIEKGQAVLSMTIPVKDAIMVKLQAVRQ